MNKLILNSIVPEKEELEMLYSEELSISSEEIKQSVLEKIKKENEKGRIYMPKKRSIIKTFIAAATLVCMCSAICATGYAAKIAYDKYLDKRVTDTINGNLKEAVSDNLKADESQIIPAIAAPLAYTENNGVKLSVVQTVGDGDSIYILVEAEVPDGYDIFEQADAMAISSFEDIELKMDDQDLITCGVEILNTDEGKNKATFLFNIANDGGKLIDNNVSITFKNLKSADELPDINGEWTLNWKMSYQDVSVDATPAEAINLWGVKATFEYLNISPFSLSFELNGDFNDVKIPTDLTKEFSYATKPYEKLDIAFNGKEEIIQINFKDGTSYDLQDIQSGRFTNSDPNRFKCIITFADYIDPTQISSIEFVGNDIPIEIK